MEKELPKYVYLHNKRHGKITKSENIYEGSFKYKNTRYYCGTHSSIRAAQIAVDRKRLELGLDTVILKKKEE